jgi:hypothetical protein
VSHPNRLRVPTAGLSRLTKAHDYKSTERGNPLEVRGEFMKKVKSATNELRPEYKRSDFKKVERGKYYERVKASSNVVVLDPEVAAVFPNSAAVNKALRSLAEVAESASRLMSGSKRRSRAGRG